MVAVSDARGSDATCDGGERCDAGCTSCVAPAHAVATCVDGACGFRCVEPSADCDEQPGNGCEVDLSSSVAHCGTCGSPCPAEDNASVSCVAGRCVSACLDGFERRDGRCERVAIRLLYPQSTAVAKDDRPTFRWTATGGADSYRLELSTRPGGSAPEIVVETARTSLRLDERLTPGEVYFWRVVAVQRGRDVARSARWFFRPTARRVPLREHAFRAIVDLDFDGVEDVAVSRWAGSSGSTSTAFGIYTYSLTDLVGSSTPTPVTVRVGPASTFMRGPVSVGDVDGDGCSDLASAALNSGVLIFGSPSRAYSTVSLPLDHYLAWPQHIGDINGDGFADLVVLHNDAAGVPQYEIALGGPNRAEIGRARVPVSIAGLVAPLVLPIGVDLDLDGSNEIGVRGSADYTQQQWVRWREGAASLERVRSIGHSRLREVIGDVNGDGFVDYRGEDYVSVFAGSPSGPDDAPISLRSPPRPRLTSFAAVGDVNDDGIDDLVAKLWPLFTDPALELGVSVFLGSPSAVELSAADSEYSVASISYTAAMAGTQMVFDVKKMPGSRERVLVSIVGGVRHAAVLTSVQLTTPATGSVEILGWIPRDGIELVDERFASMLAPTRVRSRFSWPSAFSLWRL